MQLGANERDMMSELVGVLGSLAQAREENVSYQCWGEAKDDMREMFLAVKRSDDIMLQNQLYEKAIVNMDYVERLFSELDEFCDRDFAMFTKGVMDLKEYADLQRMLFGSMAARGRMFTEMALNAINYCYVEQDSARLPEISLRRKICLSFPLSGKRRISNAILMKRQGCIMRWRKACASISLWSIFPRKKRR